MSDAPFTPLPLTRLSICPCGYGVLRDEITVGTVYMVNLATIRGGFDYRCGKCGRLQKDVTVIDAAQRLSKAPTIMPVPWGLFERSDDAPALPPATEAPE